MAAPKVYSVGSSPIANPTGTERIWVDNGSGGNAFLTAAQIAALAANLTPFVSTAVTATVGTTLTAAQLFSDQIVRSGPSAAFTDTTDTAVAIIAALPSPVIGDGNTVSIKNATAFPMTLQAGLGVTLPATVLIPAFSVGTYNFSMATATTVTAIHVDTTPIATGSSLTAPSLTALTTVGAGVILAAGFSSGFVQRTGIQSAGFTDTTDTAAAIIAACAQLVGKVGTSIVARYINSTTGAGGFPATLTGGANVTVSGITVIPAQSWADYIVTQTVAGTLTMVGISQGFIPHSGTVTANAATPVPVTDANVTPGSSIVLTYKSGTVGATGAFVSASTPGTGFSIKSVTTDGAVYNYTILG